MSQNTTNIDPSDVRAPSLRRLIYSLLDEPTEWKTVSGAAALVASLEVSTVRADAVRSQGRVSFSRSEEYKDGIAMLISHAVTDLIDEELREWEEWQLAGEPEIAGIGYEPGNIGTASRAVAETVHDAETDEENLGRSITPAVQYLCNVAATVDTDVIQIRRGCRSEGRVYFDAMDGDVAVGIWVPERHLKRITYDQTTTESILEAAYGEEQTPRPPEDARRGGITADPEKLA